MTTVQNLIISRALEWCLKTFSYEDNVQYFRVIIVLIIFCLFKQLEHLEHDLKTITSEDGIHYVNIKK